MLPEPVPVQVPEAAEVGGLLGHVAVPQVAHALPVRLDEPGQVERTRAANLRWASSWSSQEGAAARAAHRGHSEVQDWRWNQSMQELLSRKGEF